MTRKSKRELERMVANLEDETSDNDTFLFVRRDPQTGELTDKNGDSVDPDDHDENSLIVITHTVVMERDRAEAEGREILGPYEDAPDSRDVVRVASNLSPPAI